MVLPPGGTVSRHSTEVTTLSSVRSESDMRLLGGRRDGGGIPSRALILGKWVKLDHYPPSNTLLAFQLIAFTIVLF